MRQITASRGPRSWRPVLLSGLVFPGLGQLLSGRPWRGLFFALGSTTVLVIFLRRVVREALARLPDDPTAIDPFFPLRLAHQIRVANASFFFWATLLLVVLWVGSIVDAWRGAAGPQDSSGGSPDR